MEKMSAEKLTTCSLHLFSNFCEITPKKVVTFREERVKGVKVVRVVPNLHVKLTGRFVFSIPTFLDFRFLKETLITVTSL